jgi:hypothetical protein
LNTQTPIEAQRQAPLSNPKKTDLENESLLTTSPVGVAASVCVFWGISCLQRFIKKGEVKREELVFPMRTKRARNERKDTIGSSEQRKKSRRGFSRQEETSQRQQIGARRDMTRVGMKLEDSDLCPHTKSE